MSLDAAQATLMFSGVSTQVNSECRLEPYRILVLLPLIVCKSVKCFGLLADYARKFGDLSVGTSEAGCVAGGQGSIPLLMNGMTHNAQLSFGKGRNEAPFVAGFTLDPGLC
jgi:hypothetical protein